jgi:hypothetical protein
MIGAYGMGWNILFLSKNPEVECVAFCDVDKKCLKQAQR